jgi:hypothetical protein
MGVGLPTEYGEIPVTYLDQGVPIVVYVAGLHVSDVSMSEDEIEAVDPGLAAHALDTVKEIYECWRDYREGIITDHLRQIDYAAEQAKRDKLRAMDATTKGQ